MVRLPIHWLSESSLGKAMPSWVLRCMLAELLKLSALRIQSERLPMLTVKELMRRKVVRSRRSPAVFACTYGGRESEGKSRAQGSLAYLRIY
jgi:hypothetical protein